MEIFRRWNYRLEPVGSQADQFVRTGRRNRYVWNYFLGYMEEAYLAARSAGGSLAPITYPEMSRILTLLKAEQPDLYEAPADTLQQTLMDLRETQVRFFKKLAGRPRFRGYGHARFRFPNPKQVLIEKDWIKFPKMGWLRFRKSRVFEGSVRSLTVFWEHGHWWVSILTKCQVEIPPSPAGLPVGIDRGVSNSLALSTGQLLHFPVPTDREERFHRFLARSVSRKRKGSVRRTRALGRLNRLRRRVTDRRRDATHCVINRLVRETPVVVIEDLRLRNMTRSAKGTVAEPGRNVRAKSGLNRSLLKQAHGEFTQILRYKSVRSGVELIEVPPHYTSQQCSGCGHTAPENRPSQARFRCVSCGHEAHADVNAALNILAAGLAVTAQGGTALAARRTANPLKMTRRTAA
ncbi:MAG: transposase [Cephaloticoccus sp.]|nr:transposase [Cephaloticoccus sp.]MCF7759581.1 transposase [Cephaloticoccus sp.]